MPAAKPEPDIVLTPMNPITAGYNIEGRTPAGKAFVEMLYSTHKVGNADLMRRFREEAGNRLLTFEVNWDCEKVDS